MADTAVKMDRETAQGIVDLVPAKWKPEVFHRGPMGMGARFSATGKDAALLVNDILALVHGPIALSRPKRGPKVQFDVGITMVGSTYHAKVQLTL